MTKDEYGAFNRAVGTVIRRHRQAHGMSQMDLGKVLGVSYQQIAKSESGQNAFSAHQLARMAAHWGIPIGTIYRDAGAVDEEKIILAAEIDAYRIARDVQQIADPNMRKVLVAAAHLFRYPAARAS